MITDDLLECLKMLRESESGKRIVLEVDGKEWEIETIIVTVGNHSDGITRIVAKTESFRLDQDRQSLKTQPYYIQRGFPTAQDVEAVPNTNLPPDQTPSEDRPHPSYDVRVSVGTVRHAREWLQKYRRSLGRGDEESEILQTRFYG